LKEVRRIGRNENAKVIWDPDHGKGSHGMIHYNDLKAIIPGMGTKDLRIGTLRAIVKKLGLRDKWQR